MQPVFISNTKPERYLLIILQQWFKVLNGGIRLLNTTVNGTTYVKENIDAWPSQVTTPAGANTEFAVPHGLGRIPNGYIICWQDKAGDFYQGPATGTAWTSTAGIASGNIYLKCSVAAVTALILVF